MKHMNTAIRRVCLVIAAIVLSAAPSAADTFTYMSGTMNDPFSRTYNRPNEGAPPTSLSSMATNVPFSGQGFEVSVSGQYFFTLRADFDPFFDTFLVLYQDSFDPSTPLTNVLIADDNSGGGLNPAFFFTLSAGTTYIVIPTGFSNDDFGAFIGTITGPGVITPVGGIIVPEPTTLFLLGTGLAGVAVKVRRRCRGGNSQVL